MRALVIGGTGMLREVVLALARSGAIVTVTARSTKRLAALAAAAAEAGGVVRGQALDWRVPGALAEAAREAVARDGPVDLVVAWIHAAAADRPADVARAAASPGRPLRFVHVLGSATADPAAPDDGLRAEFAAMPGVVREEVVLGFARTGRGSRWLTDAEIAAGVLAAVARPAPRTVVGTVAPWSARP